MFLKSKYQAALKGKTVTVHCGSGITACHTLLAMDYAGLGIPKLYVGSWSEWSRNDRPLALGNIRIVDYEPAYKAVFKDLNVEWISTYFVMEAADYKALDNPETYILEKGGHILVALYNDEPVGVCALIKTQNDPEMDYELAKMAFYLNFKLYPIYGMIGNNVRFSVNTCIPILFVKSLLSIGNTWKVWATTFL